MVLAHPEDLSSVFKSLDSLSVSSDAIASKIKVPKSRNIPTVFLVMGPCRTGTTVHLKIFSNSGLHSFNNPVKNALQREMFSQDGQFEIPPEEISILIKESIGSLTLPESSYNPVEVLLKAGFPPDKIHLIANFREPLSTFASWIKNYGEKTNPAILLPNFIRSYQNAHKIVGGVKRSGINVTALVYEALRDNTPDEVIKNLFHRLGIDFTEKSVRGWDNHGAEGSRIHYGQRPDVFKSSVNDTVNQHSELKFFPTPMSQLLEKIEKNQADFIEREGLGVIYDEMRQQAENDLKLTVNPSTQIEDFAQATSVSV